MNTFRILSNGEEILGDNFRRLQDIGQRKIYIRRLVQSSPRVPSGLSIKQDDSQWNFSNLSWFWS